MWDSMNIRTYWNKKIWRAIIVLSILLVLSAFFIFIMKSNYMIALIRYVNTPPGVNCATQLDHVGDLETKAYIEYLEQGDVDYLDVNSNINTIVSRTGHYVCFCEN